MAGRTLAGAALALAPALLAGLPFFGITRLVPGLVAKYVNTSGSYPYAAVNAFNWFAALGGNWAAQDGAVLGPVTWEMLGIAHIVLLTAALAAAVVNGRCENSAKLILRGGELLIEWDRDKNLIYMTGPAVEVYEGELKI